MIYEGFITSITQTTIKQNNDITLTTIYMILYRSRTTPYSKYIYAKQ